MHALVLVCDNHYTKFEVPIASPVTKIELEQNFKNGSRDSDHAPFRGGFTGLSS